MASTFAPTFFATHFLNCAAVLGGCAGGGSVEVTVVVAPDFSSLLESPHPAMASAKVMARAAAAHDFIGRP